MSKKFTFSIGTFFSVVVLSFLLIFLVQGATTLYMRVSARLDEFARHGENVLQVTSLLLEKQVEQREEGLRAIVGGADMNDAGRDVLVAVVLDGNTVERGIKGWLPDGMLLPDELLTDEWVVNDLLDIYGRSLLTGVRTIQGKRVFAAIRLNMNELDVFGDHLLLPVISDNLGQIVWMGATKEAPALSEHLKARGFILRKKIPDQRWAIALSHQGSRVMMRQEQLPYGFTFPIAYPLASLMISSLSGLAVAAMLFLFALLVILLLWALWNRGVYKSIATIANLADEMGDRLSQIDARDPLRGAETLFTLTKRFSGFKETFVRETNSFVRDLRNLFEVILRQQEELTAFNEETEAMNQELEQVNNQLISREALWERTLEFSRAFARNQDVDAAISSTLDTLRRDVKAFGVLLSSVEGNSFRLTAWSGYNGELTNFVVSKDGIAASESIISRSPVWVEDVRAHPGAHPVHPSVKSELLIPLFQAGEEEGVLEVAFDRPMRRDSFLIETLTPVASFLGGLVHGEKMRRELKASYAYLAEKLQFVTGIYHDETEAHIARIGEYCKLLAREIGRDASEQEDIALFARLHDIGKLRIPYGILVKPGALDSDEFNQIKRHPQWGADILGDAAWLQMARNICLTHHEKWDGSGYPRGLRGEEIPWEGRVATIADIYDALRSSRSYKPAMSHELAVSILLEGDERVRPEHFDPKVLTAFRRISGKFEEIFDSNCDERDSPDCFLA